MDAPEVVAAQLEAIDAWFPGWHAWRGVNRVFYAQRRRTSPVETIRARRLGHLLIRVAVRDAEIRARLAGHSRSLTTAAPPRRSERRAGPETLRGGSCARR